MISIISSYAVPSIIVFIIGWGFYTKIDVFNAFTLGVGDGVKTLVDILPTIMGLFCAIGVFRASGAMNILAFVFKPLTDFLKVPIDLITFALLRPISGSGSLAMANDIFINYGVDAPVSKIVSVMMGSTETTFYTLAVYFGAVGVKNATVAVRSGLIADFVCFISAIVICFYFF